MYGLNSSLYLPMVRGGECIGVLLLGAAQPGIFSGADIALAKSFRDQAVIAIENARLLSELRKSLAQQTATADVLRIISSTPGELEPVFQAMQENASRLCEAPFGTMLLRDGDVLRIVAKHVPPTAPAMFERGSEMVISENTTHPVVRVVNSKEVIQIADLLTEPSYIEGNPRVVAFVDLDWRAHRSVRTDAQGQRVYWGIRQLQAGSAAVRRQTDRIGKELRRAGRYRHRKRAAADRAARSRWSSRRRPRRCLEVISSFTWRAAILMFQSDARERPPGSVDAELWTCCSRSKTAWLCLLRNARRTAQSD